MLNFNQDQKSQKIPSIFCADTEYLLEKIYTFDNDPTETNKQTNGLWLFIVHKLFI